VVGGRVVRGSVVVGDVVDGTVVGSMVEATEAGEPLSTGASLRCSR
jgi:hypothetical protein